MGKSKHKLLEMELEPGFTVEIHKAKDGKWVISLEGGPKDDPDCEGIRVYCNDGFAAEWVSPGDPRYPAPAVTAECHHGRPLGDYCQRCEREDEADLGSADE